MALVICLVLFTLLMRWRISCKLAKKNHLALRHFIRYSFLELHDRILELRLQSIVEFLLVNDLLCDFRMLRAHELEEVRLELESYKRKVF